MALRNLQQYRSYLARLDYPEYANNEPESGEVPISLDLSLWSDVIPQEVATAVLAEASMAVGAYRHVGGGPLLELMATHLHCPKGQTFITAGADDALRILARYCIRPNSRVLIPVPSFGRYEYHAYINEAKIEYLRFDEYPYDFDVDKIIDSVKRHDIETVFLGNPNNPTGSSLSIDQLAKLARNIAPASLILDESLVIDEADLLTTHSLVEQYQNIFICGSFSKLYCLAGLRIGYLVIPKKQSSAIQNLISPFEVDALGMMFAEKVLEQHEWLAARRTRIQSGVALLNCFEHEDLRVSRATTSVGTIELRDKSKNLYELLRNEGIATVSCLNFRGLENANAVRIIIRNEQDILLLLRTLQKKL